MRYLLWSAVVLGACSGSDARSASTISDSARGAIPLSGPRSAIVAQSTKYAGTWSGRSYRGATDTGVAWTSVTALGSNGLPSGTLTFTGGGLTPAVPLRMTAVTESTFTEEMGPYLSPTAHVEVTATAHGRLSGDSMSGTFEMRPTTGGAPIRGRFAARRTAP